MWRQILDKRILQTICIDELNAITGLPVGERDCRIREVQAIGVGYSQARRIVNGAEFFTYVTVAPAPEASAARDSGTTQQQHFA